MMMIIITRYPASEDRLIVRPLLSRVCALRLQPAEPQPYTHPLVSEAWQQRVSVPLPRQTSAVFLLFDMSTAVSTSFRPRTPLKHY